MPLCAGLVPVLVSVNTSVVALPSVMLAAPKVLATDGAALTATQAPDPAGPAAPPPNAASAIAALILVTALICALPLVLATCGQTPSAGVPDVVMLTVMVQVVCALVIVRPATVITLAPAVAVTLPPVQVPPTTDGVAITRPAGKVSVKLNAWVGLPAGWLTANVSVCVLPTINIPPNVLPKVGTAGLTVTHAPLALEPPPAAVFPTFAVIFVVAPIFPLPFVLFACGQVPTVAAAAVVTATVMVQLVAGLTS